MKELSAEQIARLSPEARGKYDRQLHKVKRNRKILFGICGTLVTIAVLLALSMTVLFNITSVKVSKPGSYYTPDQIILASGLDVGDNMIRTDFSSAELRIEKNLPYVQDAKITKKLTGQVTITITDAKETGIIDFNNGSYLIINNEFKVLRKVEEYPENSNLRRIITKSNPKCSVGDVYKFTSETEKSDFETLVNALESVDLFDKITEIDLTDRASLKAVYKNRLRLIIGTTEEIDVKLKGAAETIALEDKNNPETIAEINLTIPKKVFVNPVDSLYPPEEETDNNDKDTPDDAEGGEDTTDTTDESEETTQTTQESQADTEENDDTTDATQTSASSTQNDNQ